MPGLLQERYSLHNIMLQGAGSFPSNTIITVCCEHFIKSPAVNTCNALTEKKQTQAYSTRGTYTEKYFVRGLPPRDYVFIFMLHITK